jgi:hypothetical protein
MTKAQVLKELMDTLKKATSIGLLDDLAADIHPDIINAFCDGVDSASLVPPIASHTPGPWTLSPCDDSSDIAIHGYNDGQHQWIGDVVCDSDSWHATDANRNANAMLIAAAPDMLAALRTIVNDSPEPGEDAVLTVDGYNQACAAIAKATGTE